MARVQNKDRLPSDEENLTGIPSPDSVADSPCLRPSLSNGHCNREATTFTFPVEGDTKGVPDVDTTNNRLCCRRTRLEKRLIILAVILAVCSVTMVTILFVQWQATHTNLTTETEPCTDVCTTPDCVASASRLLSYMDDTVDPCEDFYEYSCGGWHRSNVIPEDGAHYAISTQLMETLEIQCKELIERAPPPGEAEAIGKARNFYKACMDEAVLTDRGYEPLRSLIRDIGGWPVANDGVFDEATWSLEDALATSRLSVDRNFIVQHRISVDAKNSLAHVATFNQPALGLGNREYYLQSETSEGLKAYAKYMVDMAMELRGGQGHDEVAREMADVLIFEKKIANISISQSEIIKYFKLIQKIDIYQLEREIPAINWERYFKRVLNTTHVNRSMELVVYSPPYLAGLNKILTETSNRTLANYIVWRAIMMSVDLTTARGRSIQHEFHKVVSGKNKEASRWSQCADMTNKYMAWAMGALFVNEKFDGQSKDTAFDMIGHLRRSLYTILNDTDWMDEVTRQNALEKAYAIREQIGYDEKLLNVTYLDSLYETVDIRNDTYFDNCLQILRVHARKSFKKLDEVVDPYAWSIVPVVVNAYYNYGTNSITFPAGILQPPYFSKRFSRSMNYGGIGVVIGHEVMHAFDDKGRAFDPDGNIHDWWSEQSNKTFHHKAECLVQQYSNYTVTEVDMNVNGRQTLGENIADNAGLKEAFMAYRHSVDHGSGEELPLPGLHLTHNQIFFLSFGQLWCGLHRDQDMMNLIRSDYHSPLKFRVWGTVSNSKEFAEAYNCPVGTPMNPVKKCGVW